MGEELQVTTMFLRKEAQAKTQAEGRSGRPHWTHRGRGGAWEVAKWAHLQGNWIPRSRRDRTADTDL